MRSLARLLPLTLLLIPAQAAAQGWGGFYDRQTLVYWHGQTPPGVEENFREVIWPKLTPEEKRTLGRVTLDFPLEDARHPMNFYAGSGTPLSTYVNTLNGIEVLVNGRGDMGRTPVLSTTDLLVSHQVRLGGRQRLRLELNVLNLFNRKTVRHRFNYLNRTRSSAAIDLSGTNLADGYDFDSMIDARTDPAGARDPRYGMDDLFGEGTTGHVLARWLF